MLKSMYSGVSGIKANQTKMDVVGNNVANVGTTSFKKSSARFSDTLYQTSIYAQGPSDNIGGVNPYQVGTGTKVSGIFKNTVQGNIQATGRSSDLAIDGDGYFKVQIGENKFAYTRDGSFNIDTNGNLVTSQGYRVVDTDNKPINIPTEQNGRKILAYTISDEGNISFVLESVSDTDVDTDVDTDKIPDEKPNETPGIGENEDNKVDTYAGEDNNVNGDNNIEEEIISQRLNIAIFRNPEGLEALSGNLYIATVNSGEPMQDVEHGNVHQGYIEMSNVDLSEEFTDMIITTRAFQASSKVVTTSDELLQEIINLKR